MFFKQEKFSKNWQSFWCVGKSKIFKVSFLTFSFCVFFSMISCAGQRQGLVCEEIEYRLNSMSYSPDQRYYMEEELKACREEEAKKKGGSKKQSIYDRYASQDTTQKIHTENDSSYTDNTNDIPVSELLKDSSGTKSQSIYERSTNSTLTNSNEIEE